jgi:hypothetical protein
VPPEPDASAGESATLPPDLRPCATSASDDRDAVIDRIRRGVYRSVCVSANWFDDLFGNAREEQEHEPVWGRLLVGSHWDERDGVEEEIRFRAEVAFPNLERRLHAFIGRSDRGDVVSDRDNSGAEPPDILSLPDDDEWLVGMGYNPLRSDRASFDIDLGADLEFPLNTFIKTRYRHRHTYGEHTLLNVRHTLFWENDDGLGLTTRVELDRLLGRGSMRRLLTVATLSEATLGVDWLTELSHYFRLSDRRAFALQVGAFGETDHEVIVEDYFLRTIYRQRISRDWLFLDVRPGVAWRRESLAEERELVPILTIGIELLYGQPD